MGVCCSKLCCVNREEEDHRRQITSGRRLPSPPNTAASTANPLAPPVKAEEPKGVNGWTQEVVCTWLKEELRLAQYVEVFKKQKIDGPKLAKLDNDALAKMGIKKKLHRTKILTRVQQVMQGGVWLPPRRTKTSTSVARAAVLMKQGKSSPAKGKGRKDSKNSNSGSGLKAVIKGSDSTAATKNPIAMGKGVTETKEALRNKKSKNPLNESEDATATAVADAAAADSSDQH
eukprot:g5225.t1